MYAELMKKNMQSEDEVIRKLCREHGLDEEEIFKGRNK